MSRRRPRLASRLMTAQAVVVGVGAATLLVAAALVAPRLFHEHLASAGVDSSGVRLHAEEAFTSAFGISVVVGTAMSLLAALATSWLLVRRISQPVEDLARSAQEVANGHFDVDVPDAIFSRELQQLSSSFTDMARRLAETESSRTQLVADMAHELRTPLATLEAYIDALEDEVMPRDAAAWTTMRTQVARLRRLAGDLRESAAAAEHALGMVMEPLDGRDVAMAAVDAALPRYAAKDVDLKYLGCPAACPVSADSMRLQQVLANLLDNALRHTPTGGTVTVTTNRDATSMTLTVADTGEGIPSAQLTSVFDRFHRVDPSRVSVDGSGSGLGLTIARAIVVDHGGTITAASKGLGHGSTFTVRLPALR